MLPPLGNDFVAMIKDSALVSALGVQDITQLGKVYSASTFLFFETYNVVAFLYLVMTLSLSLLVRGLERRLKRSGDERVDAASSSISAVAFEALAWLISLASP